MKCVDILRYLWAHATSSSFKGRPGEKSLHSQKKSNLIFGLKQRTVSVSWKSSSHAHNDCVTHILRDTFFSPSNNFRTDILLQNVSDLYIEIKYMNSNNFHILRNILRSKFLKYFFLSKNIQKDVERSFFLKIQDFLGHFFPQISESFSF